MKALVRKSNIARDWIVTDLAEPSPEAGQIKIQVRYAGICGSDLHIYTGNYDVPSGLASGHEFSGIIAALGEGVSGFSIGDKVTAEHTYCVCEECENCRKGNYQLCSKRISIGFNVNGGFAEYVLVNHKYVHKLPDNLSLEEGALMEPVACALHGVELINPEPTNRVLVVGPGPIGILTALIFRAHNCLVHILGIPTDQKRLEIAKTLGIGVVLNTPTEADYDIVADCSGNEQGINNGLAAVKAGGKYLQIGICEQPIKVDFDKVLFKELTVKGTYCHHYPTWEKALKMVSLGLIDPKPLISAEIELKDWEKGIKQLLSQEALKILIKF